MNKSTFKTKTFWATLLTVIGSIGAAYTGQISVIDAFQAVVPAVIGLFIRDGITTAAGGDNAIR